MPKGINVPEHVDNETAYIAGAEARIHANLMKGRRKRGDEWIKIGDRREIVDYMYRRARAGNTFYRKLVSNYEEWFTLTEKVEEIIRKDVNKAFEKRAERLATDSKSEFCGVIGERLKVTATCTRFNTFIEEDRDGNVFYTTYTVEYTDDAGNIFFYRGQTEPRGLKLGDMVEFAGNVKRHYEKDGVKKTILQRIRLKKEKAA